MKMGLFERKVALVTGAGAGIGRAAALRFAAEGAQVAVADAVADAGHETVELIAQQGGDARFFRTDTGVRDEVTAMVAAACDVYGGVHVLHNDVGVGGGNAAHEETEENWDHILRATLKSVYLCCQAVIPIMLAQDDRGSVVNTASVFGLVGSPRRAAYCAAEGGVVMLTRQMAVDYAAEGIRVNCVCPSDVETPVATAQRDDGPVRRLVSQHPIGRLATPEEVAEAVIWLASDKASFVTGVALPVDGGYTAW